jgi:hypothetical protein
MFLIAAQGGTLIFLIYLVFGPELFDNHRLLTSLALGEWLLCVGRGVGMWGLAKAIPDE